MLSKPARNRDHIRSMREHVRNVSTLLPTARKPAEFLYLVTYFANAHSELNVSLS